MFGDTTLAGLALPDEVVLLTSKAALLSSKKFPYSISRTSLLFLTRLL